nr:acyl-CoA thioesterase [Pseudomonas sp.]
MNGTVSSPGGGIQNSEESPSASESESYGASFQTLIPVRWGDLDARQHLNNTLYFRFMEEGRIQAFHRFGAEGLASEGIILASIGCDFLRSITYPATAPVTHRVTGIGRSSLDMEVLIERSDEPGVLYARGREVLVWVNYDSGKSMPWPEHVLTHLRPK